MSLFFLLKIMLRSFWSGVCVVVYICFFSGMVSGCASGVSESSCGNGICESSEDEVSCPHDCLAAICGNGVVEGNEGCDGDDLAGESCVSMGYDEGTLVCTEHCTFDTSGCRMSSNCGNGVVDSGEACDGMDLNGQTCLSLGFTGGTLSCSSDCIMDTSGCENAPECGNGILDEGEDCDGSNFGGADCVSLGFADGVLSCNESCSFDTSGCEAGDDCGNGIIDPGEDCDGGNLGGQSCQGLGYVGGVLLCDSSCQFDVSACEEAVCGNGVVEQGEECDGSNLNGMDCSDFGFSGGTLKCVDCSFDDSECIHQSCTLSESFESGIVPPSGWERVQTNAYQTWKTASYDPAEGLYYAHVEYDANLFYQDEVLISPPITCSNMTISFWAIGSYYYSVELGNYDVALWAVVGGWGGGDDVLITGSVLADLGYFNNWQWYYVSYNIPAGLDNQEIRFAWQYSGVDGAEFGLDGVSLTH